MTRFAEWLWRRYRTHYRAAFMILLHVILVGAFVPVSAVVVSFFFDMSLWEGLIWNAMVSIAMSIGLFVVLAATSSDIRIMLDWANGDTSRPTEAWLSVLRTPALLATRAFFVLTVLVEVASVVGVLALAEPPAKAVGTLAFAIPVLFAATALVGGTAIQLLFRPAAVEMIAHLPTESALPARTWSLRLRIVGSITAVCLPVGVAVTAFVLSTEATFDDYPVTMLAASLTALFVGAIINFGLVDPLTRAVQDFQEATERIQRGDYSQAVPVVAADEFGDLAVAFNQMQTGLRERESLMAAFGSYVDPALAQRLLDQGSSVFEGEDVEVSVFFADVRGFTTYAESVNAPVAVQRLNDLFEIVVPIIRDNGGHANHYLGDGLLAVFGAPNPLPDHADRAVAAAIGVQRAVTLAFGETLEVGIGVNTGRVIAGTIGGAGRLEFTVIGDVVNVASRLERMTRNTGDAILVTEATMAALVTPLACTTDRGVVDVRGRSQQQRLYAVDAFA